MKRERPAARSSCSLLEYVATALYCTGCRYSKIVRVQLLVRSCYSEQLLNELHISAAVCKSLRAAVGGSYS